MYPFSWTLFQFLLKLTPSVMLAENLFKNRIVREFTGVDLEREGGATLDTRYSDVQKNKGFRNWDSTLLYGQLSRGAR